MSHTLLSLPRELRDRIYHFSLAGAYCTGAADGQRFIVRYGPECYQAHVPWKWVLASKQIFHEARAQFHRDAWFLGMLVPGTHRSPHRSTSGPFALFLDMARISGYSTVCRLSQCPVFTPKFDIYPPNTFTAGSNFRQSKRNDWATISLIAPSLTRLRIEAFILPNLGHKIGIAGYTGCALHHESTFAPEMSFQSVEIILQCPVFQYRKLDVARLAGVMTLYEKLQEGLELAAIELTGSPRFTGKTIRDWTTGGHDNFSQRWHIEVRRTGTSGANDRRVEHLGLRNWTDRCNTCDRPKERIRCTSDHFPHQFERVELKETEDISFFCAATNETVRRVNGQFEIEKATQ